MSGQTVPFNPAAEVAQLQRRVADLEAQIRVLEAQVRALAHQQRLPSLQPEISDGGLLGWRRWTPCSGPPTAAPVQPGEKVWFSC